MLAIASSGVDHYSCTTCIDLGSVLGFFLVENRREEQGLVHELCKEPFKPLKLYDCIKFVSCKEN